MDDLVRRLEEAKKLEVGGKWDKAEELLTSLIEQFIEQDLDSLQLLSAQLTSQDLDITAVPLALFASAYNQRGLDRRMLEDYNGAFADFEEAFKVSEDGEQKAFARANQADVHRAGWNDLGTAHTALDDALIYASYGTLAHAKAVDQRGLVLAAQKDQYSAIVSYKKAREICEKLLDSQPDNKDIRNRFGQVILHLGVAYEASKDLTLVNEAYDLQVTALDIFTRLGDQQGIVNAITVMGRISLIKGDARESLTQYQKAWDILEETGYGRAISTLALDLAEAHLLTDEPMKAQPYLERFNEGVRCGEVTEHDMGIIKDQVARVEKMYKASN